MGPDVLYSTAVIPVSRELIADSHPDLLSFITKQLKRGLFLARHRLDGSPFRKAAQEAMEAWRPL